MWIIWYTYVVNDANLLQSNPVSLSYLSFLIALYSKNNNINTHTN